MEMAFSMVMGRGDWVLYWENCCHILGWLTSMRSSAVVSVIAC